MDLIKNPKIDWLGLKWYFVGASLILAIVGGVSLWTRGLNLGVDFTGGTLVYVKFKDTPDLERIRTALREANLGAQDVTRFDEPSANEVQIRLAQFEEESETSESGEEVTVGARSRRVFEALRAVFDPEVPQGKLDLNNVSISELASWLEERDPEGRREELSIEEYSAHYRTRAEAIVEVRTQRGGLFRSLDDLQGSGLTESLVAFLRENCYVGSFTLLSVESVGPKVGRELRERAQNAVLFSLLGMLIYIAFRFQFVYGIAAIVALFHDVFLTVGFFSLTEKEISLTVIAALLTLVGYSINDTIVIFDRVRENLRLMRRSDFPTIVNESVNQTLNRTLLTSGMTFLAVLALYLMGGEALNGFAFALVVGIVVGTYSSVAIASPIVVWWQGRKVSKK
ncbi:MAG: hypothetical protein Kow00109_02350 [Acidobacteriota bacterium]